MVKVQWSHVGLCPVCFVKVWCRCVVSCVVRVQYNNALWSSDMCKNGYTIARGKMCIVA